MKKKQRIKSIYKFTSLVTVSTSIVFISACSFLPKEEATLAPPLVEPVKIEYETSEVTVKTIVKQIKGLGNMVPNQQQNLFYTGSGGRIDQVLVKSGDEVKKGDVLIKMDTGQLPFELQQAEIELKKAKLRLKQLQEQKADQFAIEIAKLDVQSVEIRLTQMKNQAANARLVSPINGLVTFVTDKERGDYVEAFEDLIQVADPSDLKLLYTALSSGELTEVTVGMKATVTVDGNEVSGEVVQTPSTVPADLKEQNPDLYGRSLILQLAAVPEGVSAGDGADLVITLQEKPNALTIPKSALRSAFGREYVQILEGESKREKDIKKGIVTDTEVEVLEGLKAGDQVISK
ncbi:efflux RND transporter periplasmic adaptor subunit [Bacillus sp. AK128]